MNPSNLARPGHAFILINTSEESQMAPSLNAACHCRGRLVHTFSPPPLPCTATRTFGEICYLRFSNRNVLAGADNDELYSSKVTNVSAPVAAFDTAVAALLNATVPPTARRPTRLSGSQHGRGGRRERARDLRRPCRRPAAGAAS
jgi:hypothetical protein